MLFWISLAVVVAVTIYMLRPKKDKPAQTPLVFPESEPPVEIDPEAAKPDLYIPPETVEAPKKVVKKAKKTVETN